MDIYSNMKAMDPHNLFSIFEKGDEEVYEEHGLQDTLKNPYVLMGMVLEGMQNFQIMDVMYMHKYPKKYKGVRSIAKHKYYSKIYGYLIKIDSKKFESIYTIGESFDIGNVFLALDGLLQHFVSVEQYERCAIIKNYQDLLIEANLSIKIGK